MTTTRRHPHRGVASVAALALGLAGIAACGDDADTDDDASERSTTTLAEVDAGTVPVSAADYRLDDLPAEIAGGTALTLRNESATEVHELVAMRLTDGEDRTAEELVALPEQDLRALFAGPPALVLVAPPSDDG